MLRAYTDGSCRGNHVQNNSRLAGIGITFNPGFGLGNYSGPAEWNKVMRNGRLRHKPGDTSNNAAEIQAATTALDIANEHDIDEVQINIDSQYLLQGVESLADYEMNGWTTYDGHPVANEYWLKDLLRAQDNLSYVDWNFVRRRENETADFLARKGTGFSLDDPGLANFRDEVMSLYHNTYDFPCLKPVTTVNRVVIRKTKWVPVEVDMPRYYDGRAYCFPYHKTSGFAELDTCYSHGDRFQVPIRNGIAERYSLGDRRINLILPPGAVVGSAILYDDPRGYCDLAFRRLTYSSNRHRYGCILDTSQIDMDLDDEFGRVRLNW